MNDGFAVHPIVKVALALLLLWLGLRWFERINLYIPSRTVFAHPGTYGWSFEDLRLPAADGPLLSGWYIERGPKDPVILVCHGNAGNISHRLEKAKIFMDAGASVLLFDYRGYGKSSGSPDEQGTYEDALTFYRWLVEIKGVPPERIVVYGESLGGGVAVETALRHKSAGLILESSFTSVVDMGREVFPWLPVRHMVRYRYDNLAKLPSIRGPVLVMHSPQDDIVPYRMGRRLFEAAAEPKTFFAMKGDHNEGYIDTGAAYGAAVKNFLGRLSL